MAGIPEIHTHLGFGVFADVSILVTGLGRLEAMRFYRFNLRSNSGGNFILAGDAVCTCLGCLLEPVLCFKRENK